MNLIKVVKWTGGAGVALCLLLSWYAMVVLDRALDHTPVAEGRFESLPVCGEFRENEEGWWCSVPPPYAFVRLSAYPPGMLCFATNSEGQNVVCDVPEGYTEMAEKYKRTVSAPAFQPQHIGGIDVPLVDCSAASYHVASVDCRYPHEAARTWDCAYRLYGPCPIAVPEPKPGECWLPGYPPFPARDGEQCFTEDARKTLTFGEDAASTTLDITLEQQIYGFARSAYWCGYIDGAAKIDETKETRAIVEQAADCGTIKLMLGIGNTDGK